MFVKLKKILKNKKTMFIIGLILGLVSVPLVYAANTIYAKNVTYYNFNSGLSATNVQDAIDETYERCAPKPLVSVIKKDATIDTNIDFSEISSDTNGKGVYIRNGTQNNANPIYYYRGAVTNNNLIFADTCWKIVRTTETGGIKLIYNGVPNNGTCNNTGTSSQIGTNVFNSITNSPTYVGYMYGTPYTYKLKSMSSVSDMYYYGNDVTYSNGTYSLIDTTRGSWAYKYTSLNNNHYTCMGGTTCSTVYYIFHANSTTMYYIELTGGKTVEDALSEMLDNNTTSNTIKGNNTTSGTLDYWYYTNIEQKGYSNYIEDTVWCNDRSIYQLNGWDPDGGSITAENLGFGAYGRAYNTYTPSLSCSRAIDRFTVSTSNGNGELTYPVGLLTADEVMLAGGRVETPNSSYYLSTGEYWFTISPFFFRKSNARVFIVYPNGDLDDDNIISYSGTRGVRPSISIKSGAMITGGDGTVDKPYTISYESGGDDSSSSKATDKIINLYNDGSSINTVNIGGDTSNPQVKLNSSQAIMLDNNGDYRYYGSFAKNYVTFNNETWRIIGAFNNVDDGTGKKETRLKIIRDESIGEYSWDSSASTVNSGDGVNDWSKSDLMTELNTLYYNSTSGTCYNGGNNASTTCDFTNIGLDGVARSMIDDAVYYLGGVSSNSLYADDFYNEERGTDVYDCSKDDGACPRVTSWTGKVGIMYVSDFIYARNLSVCTGNGNNISSSCKNNWLFTSSSNWTIVPSGNYPNDVYRSMFSGNINYADAYLSSNVRPVVYLKSNIKITGGIGTESDPYQLSL